MLDELTGKAASPPVTGPTVPSGTTSPPELPDYLQHYRDALRLQPDNEDVLDVFAGSLMLALDVKTLLRELRTLADEFPGAAGINLLLAQLLDTEQQRAAAIELLQRALPANHWRDARLVRQLVEMLLEDGRFDDGMGVLRNGLKQAPLQADVTMRLSAALLFQQAAEMPDKQVSARARQRCRSGALSEGRRALALIRASPSPETFDVSDCLMLVRLFHTLDAYADALTLVRACRARFPDARGELDVWEAESLLRLGKEKEATALLAALEKKYQLPASPPGAAGPPVPGLADLDARREFHENNLNLARLFLEINRPKEAAAAYERALKNAPGDYRLRLILGQLYLGMDLPDKAIEMVDPVEQLPQRKYMLLSRAYYRLAKLPDAARYLAMAEDAALKAQDTLFFDRQFYLYYGTVCEESGLTDRAIEKGSKALELDPTDAVSANFLGYVLADHNRDLERAEKLVRQAVTAEPNNEAYADSMAWVCYRLKRFADALQWIHKAIKLSGTTVDAVIMDHAGDIAMANGLVEEAREFWSRALQTGGKEIAPAKIREKIKQLPALAPKH